MSQVMKKACQQLKLNLISRLWFCGLALMEYLFAFKRKMFESDFLWEKTKNRKSSIRGYVHGSESSFVMLCNIIFL